jgi:hypothetical protein
MHTVCGVRAPVSLPTAPLHVTCQAIPWPCLAQHVLALHPPTCQQLIHAIITTHLGLSGLQAQPPGKLALQLKFGIFKQQLILGLRPHKGRGC